MQNLVYKQFEVYYDHLLGHLSILYSPVDNGSSFSLLEATLSICNPDGTPLSSKNICNTS